MTRRFTKNKKFRPTDKPYNKKGEINSNAINVNDIISSRTGGKSNSPNQQRLRDLYSSKEMDIPRYVDEHGDPIHRNALTTALLKIPSNRVEHLYQTSNINFNSLMKYTDARINNLYSILDEYGSGYVRNSHLSLGRFLRYLLNGRNHSYLNDNPLALKTVWDQLSARDATIKKGYAELLHLVDDINRMSQHEFLYADSFFRGTDRRELDFYLNTHEVGHGRLNSSDVFGFSATSPSKPAALRYSRDGGVLIEFDGDDIRLFGHSLRYDLFWRDYGVNSEMLLDAMMNIRNMRDLEVRLPPDIPLTDLKIKNIYIKNATIEDMEKYSKLGNVIVT